MKDFKGNEIQVGDIVCANVQSVGLVEGEVTKVTKSSATYKVLSSPPAVGYYKNKIKKGTVKQCQVANRIYVVVESAPPELPDVSAYKDAAASLLAMAR